MANYRLSRKADEDLAAIYKFSYLRFGETKADAYLISLEKRFKSIAENPEMGKSVEHLRNGYYRYKHISHSIFYQYDGDGLLVVRILHNSMDAKRHL